MLLRNDTMASLDRYLKMIDHLHGCIDAINKYRWAIMQHDNGVKLPYIQSCLLDKVVEAENAASDASMAHKLAEAELIWSQNE